MAQVIVRNLDEAVVTGLKEKAKLRGRSLEQELRSVLTEAAGLSPAERLAVANRVRAMTPRTATLDSTDIIRADRDRR